MQHSWRDGGGGAAYLPHMILYSDDTSPYCAPVRVAVYAKGLAIQILAPPGGLKSDAYRALSGTGTIPCLALDDGSALPESTVILGYLDEKFPAPSLLPGSAEARARALLLVRLGMDGVIGPIVGLFHDLGAGVATAQATALERLETGLGRIELFLAGDGFAAGPDFSQADCVLGSSLMGVAAFAGMLGAADLLTRHPKLAAYNARVVQHPAVAKVLAELQAAIAANPLPG
jgi:glutathione S-transferase